jgi:hypothetical protein
VRTSEGPHGDWTAGRKTTAKRKPKRKAAPARKKKARAKAPSKKKRTKAKGREAEAGAQDARRRQEDVKKTKPQGARAKMSAACAGRPRRQRRRRFRKRFPRRPRRAHPEGDARGAAAGRRHGARRRARAPLPRVRAARSHCRRGARRDRRGYAQGPASPPSWLHVDVARPIAEGLVERFRDGDRAHDIDAAATADDARDGQHRAVADAGRPVGDPERAVLASFCLGSWDPATDETRRAERDRGFVIPGT